MSGQRKSRRRPGLVPIGKMAEEFGFTTRTLRLYEERGLISPRRIGNRRVYSDRDRRRLETIAKAKRIGMPLDAIREIVRRVESSQPRQGLEFALALYRARLEQIHAEREELKRRVDDARALISELEAKLSDG
jgi:DNA-binding transcriptional MerR regulator